MSSTAEEVYADFTKPAERRRLSVAWLSLLDNFELSEEGEVHRQAIGDEVDRLLARYHADIQKVVRDPIMIGSLEKAIALREAAAELTPEEIING